MYTSYNVASATCSSMTSSASTVLCYVPGVTDNTYAGLCGASGSEPTSNKCLNQAQILSAAGMTGASYLISCQHINTIALDLNNNICNPMVPTLTLILILTLTTDIIAINNNIDLPFLKLIS